MKEFLRGIKKSRRLLKGNRKRFWENNKKNFEKNLMKIIKKYKIPKPWKIYVVAGNFISSKRIMPYDYDSWGGCFLVCATKRQGYETMLFFNRAKSFLSLNALVPLVAHEIEHVKQDIRSPQNSLKTIINNKLSQKYEKEADQAVKKLSDEFRKELVLESILYCYDIAGWSAARRMAYFFYKKRGKMYGGGYMKEMRKEEYETFIKAKGKRDINLFIRLFEY